MPSALKDTRCRSLAQGDRYKLLRHPDSQRGAGSCPEFDVQHVPDDDSKQEVKA